EVRRGIPKGASPLCVVVGEGYIGEGPHRKGFSSRACFWLLFARAKSNSGHGGETPETPGVRGRSPERFRKETCFSPPARRWANLSPPVPCAGTARSKPGVRGRSPRKTNLQAVRRILPEPLSQDLVGLADDDEGVGVDLGDGGLDGHDLAALEGAEHHLLL